MRQSKDAATLLGQGLRTLADLEKAQLDPLEDLELTAPEWKLLASFELNSLDSIRRRMDERTLLAAYDGAPSALTEVVSKRATVPTVTNASGESHAAVGTQTELHLRTTLEYDRDSSRGRLEYSLEQCSVVKTANERPARERSAKFYAVTFDVLSGKVIRRETDEHGQMLGMAEQRCESPKESALQELT
jgi:hypothetical protein